MRGRDSLYRLSLPRVSKAEGKVLLVESTQGQAGDYLEPSVVARLVGGTRLLDQLEKLECGVHNQTHD